MITTWTCCVEIRKNVCMQGFPSVKCIKVNFAKYLFKPGGCLQEDMLLKWTCLSFSPSSRRLWRYHTWFYNIWAFMKYSSLWLSRTCSILHIFCECDISSALWQHVGDMEWFLDTDRPILFGDKTWDPIVNRIIILKKSTLFRNKTRFF